jgi:hypothetical protein
MKTLAAVSKSQGVRSYVFSLFKLLHNLLRLADIPPRLLYKFLEGRAEKRFLITGHKMPMPQTGSFINNSTSLRWGRLFLQANSLDAG